MAASSRYGTQAQLYPPSRGGSRVRVQKVIFCRTSGGSGRFRSGSGETIFIGVMSASSTARQGLRGRVEVVQMAAAPAVGTDRVGRLGDSIFDLFWSGRGPGWADLRQDKMTNPAPGLPHGGLREPWDGLRLEKECRLHQTSVPEANYQARSWVLCVFGAGRKKIKR